MTTTAAQVASGSAADTVLERAVRKNMRHIIPFLALGYLVNFLDRTSVGFAALQMNQAIGLTATQFGWGAGVLFVGYCACEVPSNLAMYRFGARRWLARILVSWGLAAAATSWSVGPHSFYFTRLLLGVFEAGFFPGVIWYLSIWFPHQYRTRAMALFTAAAPLSQMLGGPISVTLLKLDGLCGLAGWKWMFILEGVPAVFLGVVCLWWLCDTPADAKWLTTEEREELLRVLAAEPHERPKKDFAAAMKDPRVLLSSLIVFCYTVGSYGLSLWLPLILKGYHLSTTAVGWLSSVPFLFATGCTLIFARFVDKTGLKIYTLLFTFVLGITGMVMSVFFSSLVPAVIWISVGLVGVISSRMVFYTIPQVFLTGAAAAGGLAFINSVGTSGGIVGPWMVGLLKDMTGSYSAGMFGMAAFLVVAVVLAISLKRLVRSA